MPKEKLDLKQISAVESVAADILEYDNVIAICMDSDGNVLVHSTIHYPPDILWAVEQAKAQLFECGVQHDS